MVAAMQTEGLRRDDHPQKMIGWFIAKTVVFILLGISAIIEPGMAVAALFSSQLEPLVVSCREPYICGFRCSCNF